MSIVDDPRYVELATWLWRECGASSEAQVFTCYPVARICDFPHGPSLLILPSTDIMS